MQTNFSLAQLADPAVRESESILRKCVHCGFCTATCPTFVLLGDELDSPRGRIYLIKDMLENGKPANDEVVRHVDRCLSCLSCMTTCPSGVNYMHLVDHARAHIEETYSRPLMDRALRALLAWLLPHPNRFRFALLGAAMARPFAGLFGDALGGRVKAMLSLAPKQLPARSPLEKPGTRDAAGPRKLRVAMLAGCAQKALAPSINDATIRLLTRHNVEVVVPKDAGCCGALTHHMGKEEAAMESARANIDAWAALEEQEGGLDAVVINASGCGTTVKDYGFLLREDKAYAEKAARIAAKAKDITELLTDLDLPESSAGGGLRVTYHSACSMQHGQKIKSLPQALLRKAGFAVKDVPEGHLCCGSAGTYNMLQPKLATRLRDRKLANIAKTAPEVIAAGNLGCITQIASGSGVPVVHTVELLDWATGGPKPEALDRM